MISENTTLIADIGHPTFAFKAPLISNPWLNDIDIDFDTVVVPLPRDALPMRASQGPLHKIVTCDLVDELMPTAAIAGAANAVLVREDGTFVGDLVVNATPLGTNDGDPSPMDVERIPPTTFVGEVLTKQTITPFLAAAQPEGCPIQVGSDMLYEMIPAYLEFFGFGTATPEELRDVSQTPS